MKSYFVAVLMGCAAVLTAQDGVVSEAGAASMNQEMQVQVVTTAGMMMDEVFDRYAKECGISSYGVQDSRGRTYITGKANVIENVNSPKFIPSRTMAYERAYQDAIARMVLDITGVECAESIREFFEDSSDDRYDPPRNYKELQEGVQSKMERVTEAALDNALRKLGVEQEKIQGMPIKSKKNIYTDSIIKKSVKKAVFASTGFIPIQTFETHTEDGRYTVGVVIRYDQDTKEIARCLKNKRRPAISRANGLTIDQALPTPEEMITQFGVRIYFDETGAPSLLSFAQFGSAETSTDARRQERALEHAMRQAENLADHQLTLFINSSMNVLNENEIGEVEMEDVYFGEDPEKVSVSTSNMIDRIHDTSKQKGTDTLAGRSTVYKKILVHPSGHKVAVVVRRWSFAQLANVEAIKTGKRPEPPKPAKAPAVKSEGDRGVRQGRAYDF